MPLLQIFSITVVFDRLILELNRAAGTALFEICLLLFSWGIVWHVLHKISRLTVEQEAQFIYCSAINVSI